MNYCKFAKREMSPNEHLKCTLTNEYCAFQRWCLNKNQIVHTDSFMECKARRDNMSNRSIIFDKEEEKQPLYEPKNKMKNTPTGKYKVVLVSPKYIIIDYNGNNKQVNGKFNVKIGDYVEL